MKAMETRFDLEGFLIRRGELIQALEVAGINEESLEAYVERCVAARPPQNLGPYSPRYDPEGGIERVGVVYGEETPLRIDKIEILPEFDGSYQYTICEDDCEARILETLRKGALGIIHNHPGSSSKPTLTSPDLAYEFHHIRKILREVSFKNLVYAIVCSMPFQKFIKCPSRYTNVYLFKQRPPHLMYPRVVLV